ncbi:MAG TPA: protein kinase [Gemmataceae bacterium]|jgi:WD40 repeat protein
MNPHDALNDEDKFGLLLERYNDVLSAGGEVDPSLDSSLSPQLQERLRQALRCLHLLRQFPPSCTAVPPLVRKADLTLHDSILGGQVDRFRILRRLGHGGGGIVFLAFDPDLQREVALKVPHLPALLELETRRRFLREARAAARLDHPNLVPVHEAGESNGVCFLVSTYCGGGSLAQWLAARPLPVPARQAAELLADLAGAVQHINDHGIYHRDIKPGNILLDLRTVPPGEPAFVPRLTDFGLAKLREAQTESTRSGVMLGTLSYMAPEQVEGRVHDIGPATDVYGLGAVLYEVLAGRPPFRGTTDADTLRQVLTEEPVPLRRVRRDVPLDLETICLKCLEKEPVRRYASAADLAGDLRCFLNGEPIRARPLGRIERLSKWVRRRPAKSILFASGLLLTLVLVGGSLLLALLKQTHDADLETAAKQREESRKALLEKERGLRQNRYADDIAQAWHSWEDRRIEDMFNSLVHHHPPSAPTSEEDLRGFEWFFLSRLTHAATRVSRYPDHLCSLAFSPDGLTCASGHGDGTVVLWDTTTCGRPRAILKEHKFQVDALAYSRDGDYLASGSGSRYDGDYRGELLLWDARKRQVIHVLSSSSKLDSLAFSPDGRTLASVHNLGRVESEIKLWSMPSGTQLTNIPFSTESSAVSVAFSSDGTRIAVGQANGNISLCDAVTGRILNSWSGHQGYVPSITCGHKDAVLVSGGSDGRVRLSSLGPGGSLIEEYRHEDKVWSVTLSPDDQSVASISHSMLKVWDRVNQKEHFARDLHGLGRVAAFSPDGKTLAFGDEEGRLWLKDVCRSADGKLSIPDESQTAETRSWLGHHDGTVPSEAWAVAFSPDGKVLASAGDDYAVRLWDPADGRELAVLRGHKELVTSISFSADGHLLASGSFDEQATVKLWNWATGAEVATLRGHTKPVDALAFSPDGKWLATAGRDRFVRLWNVATRQQEPIFSNNYIESMAFSPDGCTLAVSDESQGLLLWDMVQQKVRLTLPRHPRGRVAVAFSPDGKTLATGDYEGTVRFFDAATGDLRLSVRNHTDAVNCLAFTPDSKTLASAGFDKKVKLWQTTTGRELLTFPEQKDRVRWLAFSPDGTLLATAGHDGILKIYRAGSDHEAQPSR